MYPSYSETFYMTTKRERFNIMLANPTKMSLYALEIRPVIRRSIKVHVKNIYFA